MKRLLFPIVTALLLLIPTSLTQPTVVLADGRCGIEQSSPNVSIVVAAGDFRVYDFGLTAPCADGITVYATYFGRDKRATETIRQNIFGGPTMSREYTCPDDPWLEPATKCTLVKSEGNLPSAADLAITPEMVVKLDGGTASVFLLSDKARQTLKSLYQAEVSKQPASKQPPSSSGGGAGAPPAKPSFSLPQFKPGTDGPRVEAFQLLFSQHTNLVPTGVYDSLTIGAVNQWHQATGAAVPGQSHPSGLISDRLWAQITSRVAVGAQGAQVKALQTLLNWQGIEVVVDGDFGPQTEAAVREFQMWIEVEQTGSVTPAIWVRLFNQTE